LVVESGTTVAAESFIIESGTAAVTVESAVVSAESTVTT